jgi:hypothetical protein
MMAQRGGGATGDFGELAFRIVFSKKKATPRDECGPGELREGSVYSGISLRV